ncbi:MAG: sulfatase-like hydrolase/transferase [Luteitalea sp.]|nr:sulfatase-like hydrolase/transferase [Luteitalea sp.]
MHRRDFLKAGGLSVAAGWGCDLSKRSRSANRPSVLFIAVDDLNGWLGCLGGHPHAVTPHIDGLASRGVLFSNAHCQAPICGPSRTSLMTGLLPSTTGVYGQIQDDRLRAAHPKIREGLFLPEYFQQHGYHTMGIGKLFHQHAPDGVFADSGGREAGFGPTPPEHFVWDQEKTGTDWGVYPDRDDAMPDYRSAQWAIERLGRSYDVPFFLGVGLLCPHVPWYVPQKWFDLFDLEALSVPPYLPNDDDDIPPIGRDLAAVPMMPTTEWAIKNGEWKRIVQAYLACVAFTDHYVGQMLNALARSAHAGHTYVVLWSDHGYHLGEKNRFAKQSIWEESTRVPLIVAGPGIDGGHVCSRPAGMIDVYPTLLDLCGLPPNSSNEGRSLRPLLDDPRADWPHPALMTYGRNNHAVRTEHFRYIRYEDGSEELYDHRHDRHEWKNLAGLDEHRQTIERLKDYLPRLNARWSPESRYDWNPYLTEHRKRNL